MASKAWYKPSALPTLVAKFKPECNSSSNKSIKSIEVWTTTCIVTNFGMQRNSTRHVSHTKMEYHGYHDGQFPRCSTLINPANPFLTGPHSFPYFPRGGPQPANPPDRTAHHIMGYVTQWGGMDVGNGMLFPAAVIDGLVHQLGGEQLKRECSLLPKHSFADVYVNQQTSTEIDLQVKCPVGTASVTSAGSKELEAEYDNIVHTVPPFYNHPPSIANGIKQQLGIDANVLSENSWAYQLLLSCYRHSFELAFDDRDNNRSQGILDRLLNGIRLRQYRLPTPENRRVAVPLLGAGCRGFPVATAIDAAAEGSASWLSQPHTDCFTDGVATTSFAPREECIAFGLLETSHANELAEKIEERISMISTQ